MKFRTRIWMLPASAAGVFIAGLLVSLFAGSQTSHGLQQLRDVHAPYDAALNRVDRNIEQFRLTLQTAAAEGDSERLSEVEGIAAATDKVLSDLAAIPGKTAEAAELRQAFASYRDAALGATRALLAKTAMTNEVQRMQQAQTALSKLLEDHKQTAQLAVTNSQDDATAGVNRLLWLNLLTGMAVLAVLGSFSWFTVRSVWRDLGGEPDALREAAQRIADGDLRGGIVTEDGEGSLAGAVAQMLMQLRQTVGGIRDATSSIDSASTEIANGNTDLSDSTNQQAGALEKTAASMQQLGGIVKQNSDNALQANKLAQGASTVAIKGGEVVGQVVTTMKGINDSSRKIADIIGVIDVIAFQTNILALNAAVEAARAGDHGRGFAVVAAEVRSLAQRSAEAAREIKTLITASVERVETGTTLVDQAGVTMNEIVEAIKRVTAIMSDISKASVEQSAGVAQVGQAVMQMDKATKANAGLVEESAAAAESLKQQAQQLVKLVAVFKLNQPDAAQVASAARDVVHEPHAPSRHAIAEPTPAPLRTGTGGWQEF